MSDNTIQEVRERLIRIETLLETGFKEYDLRIRKIEENQVWLYRLFIGGIVTGAISLLIAFVK